MLSSLHQEVHNALAAGDFETARRLSRELGQAIIRQASALAPADRADYVRHALNRLQEHLSFARVLRAHLASQVKANSAVCLYHQASDPGNSWHFDA
jgi:hypothetical protein